ncbi:MAG: methyltransferase domain-containing protein [bacterium]|nr:methyltransferase domain-containing protein [bacterium]
MSTLTYYNNNAYEYFDTTKMISLDNLYSIFLNYITTKGKILDFGCGSGRDSKYFKDKGYDVYLLDGSINLANIVETELGLKVKVQDFNDFDEKDKYDGVWACASLLHVKKENISNIILKIKNSIHDDGIIYISMKDGVGEEIDNFGRYYNYVNEKEFEELLKPLHLKVDKYIKTNQRKDDSKNIIWHNFFIKKIL